MKWYLYTYTIGILLAKNSFCLKVWKSEPVPEKRNCVCAQWTFESKDIQWWNHTFTNNESFKDITSCRYAIQIIRTRCVLGKIKNNYKNTTECQEGEDGAQSSYYLPRNRCHPSFQNVKEEEKCNDCDKNYKASYSLCYKRKNTVYYCKVNWTKCNNLHCETNQQQLQWSFVKLSDDCKSPCTDGISVGMIRYTKKCVLANSAFAITSQTTSQCKLGELKGEYKKKCQRLPLCDYALPTTIQTLPTITSKSIQTTRMTSPYYPKTCCEIITKPRSVSHTTRTTMAKTTSETTQTMIMTSKADDALDTSSSWNSFVIAMTIIGIILLLVVICLSSAVCYIVICQDKKNKPNAYNVARYSRNSLEKGYNRLSYLLGRRNESTEANKHQTSQVVHLPTLTSVCIENNNRETKTNKDDDDAIYWAIGDETGGEITSCLNNDVMNTERNNASTSATVNLKTKSKCASKISASASHGNFSRKSRNPLAPPTGDEVRCSSDEKLLEKRVSCPTYDWRSNVHLSEFIDDDDQSIKDGVTNDKLSFDDIISEISTLRRDLSFITTKSKADVSPASSSPFKSVFSDLSSSSEESLTLQNPLMMTPRKTSPYVGPTRSHSQGKKFATKKPTQLNAPNTTSQLCNVTSLTQTSPAISVFHPRDRNFGLIRGREEFRMGKIFIDTTKAKPEHKNTDASTSKPHHSTMKYHLT